MKEEKDSHGIFNQKPTVSERMETLLPSWLREKAAQYCLEKQIPLNVLVCQLLWSTIEGGAQVRFPSRKL